MKGKRLLAFFLSMLLMLSTMSSTVYAGEIDQNGTDLPSQIQTEESVTDESTEPEPTETDSYSNDATTEESENSDESSSAETTEDVNEDASLTESADDVSTQTEENSVETSDPEEEVIAMPAQDFTGEANGVKVTVNAPEGAFPEGTVMNITEAEDSAVQAAADAAEADVEDVKAVDISFSVNDEEIEPAVAINVSLEADLEDKAAEDAVVVHVADDEQTEVIEDTTVEDQLISFEADAFSVYAIVTPEERTTYEFYNGNTLVETQIVKDGDTLVEPAVPEGDGEFLGWYVGEEKLTFGQVSLDDTIKGTTIRVDAKFNGTVYVTFYDADGTTVVAVKKVENGSVTTTDVTAQPAAAGQAFDGWTTTQGGSEKVGETFSTETNASLYPVFVSAAWLTFDANGDGATATETQYVKAGETTTAPADPQRPGYTFAGWYTQPEGGEAFVFENALTENTTVYAHWTPAAANYTVIIWKQKVTDNKNATDDQKTYDYEESTAIPSTTGATASVRDEDISKSYTGFHLGRYDSETTVAADGSTILNVYYDRNLNTIIFSGWGSDTNYSYTETTSTDNNTTYYGLVDGQYVELTRTLVSAESYLSTSQGGSEYNGTAYTRSGRWPNYTYTPATPPYNTNTTYYYYNPDAWMGYGGYEELYWVNNSTYTWTTPDGLVYTGTRYTRNSYNNSTAFTGLYGQNFSMYGYEWPSEYEWNENRNGGGTTQTFLNSFSVTDTSYILYSQGGNNNDSTVYHYIENVDSTNPSNVNNYTDAGSGKKSSNATFNFSNKFTGFTVYGYRKNTYSDMTVLGNTTSTSSRGDLYVYHSRNSYTITFINGDTTVDTVTKKFEAQLSANDAPDSSSLTYPGNAADANHYTFAGWYTDPEGTTPFDFTGTMPSNNLVAYAKWLPEQVTVTYDANGGKADKESEVISYNGKATGATATWENHTFLGWEDPEGNLWNFESPVTHDLALTAAWRSNVALKVAYSIESVVDNGTYTDGSRAIVKDYTDADGRFIGWQLGDTVYYPGDVIEVNSANDTLDGNGDGVVTLTAVYDELMETSITFDANGGSFAEGTQIEKALANNEGVDLDTIEVPVKAGYTFLGWATTADAAAAEFTADGTNAEEIAADYNGENILYAVWEEGFFYIYHSSSANGAIEKISMTQVNDDGTYDIVAKTAANYLYGGYYEDYDGKGNYANDGKAPTEGNYAYTGAENAWNADDALRVNGMAMKPVAGTTYYLKEVPSTYLRPATYVVYDTISGNKITQLYLMTATDDNNYDHVGFDTTLTGMDQGSENVAAPLYNQVTVHKEGQDDAYATLSANTVFGLSGCLAFSENKTNYIKTNANYLEMPYYVTYDGIKVTGDQKLKVYLMNATYKNWQLPGIMKITQNATITATFKED